MEPTTSAKPLGTCTFTSTGSNTSQRRGIRIVTNDDVESRTHDLMTASHGGGAYRTVLYLSDILLTPFCRGPLNGKDTLTSYVMATLSVILCFVILTAQGVTTYTVGGGGMQFGVVIDAGSSGSRVRVYGWTRPPGHQGLIPQFGEAFSYKVRPGISAFNTPRKDLSELDNYIGELLTKAKDYVPRVQHRDTPIYVMATAGKSDVISISILRNFHCII